MIDTRRPAAYGLSAWTIGTVVLLAALCSAQDLPPALQQPGYQHFYNLEFDEALRDFEVIVAHHPDNPENHNLVAQALIFRTMFRAGALESSLISDKNPFFERPRAPMSNDDEARFLQSLETSNQLSRKRLAKNPDDIPALYAMGTASALRADYDFVVKKAWVATLRDSTQARKYHNRVTQLDPGNYDARLTQGLHTYIGGNLVFSWKQLGFIAGFRGDKQTGIDILREVAARAQFDRADAAMFLIAIYRRDHRPAEAIPFVETLIRWFPRNYLFRIEQVHLYLDLKQKDKASELVAEIERLKQSRTPGFEKMPEAKLQELRSALP